MNFRDARQRADVFGVLTGRAYEIFDLMIHQLDRLGKRFVPFDQPLDTRIELLVCHLTPPFFFAAFFARASTPFLAISFRCSSDSFAMPFGTFAAPPSRPSATAAGFFFFAIRKKSTTDHKR